MRSSSEPRWYHFYHGSSPVYSLCVDPYNISIEIAYIENEAGLYNIWELNVSGGLVQIWPDTFETVATYPTLEQALEDASKIFDVSPEIHEFEDV